MDFLAPGSYHRPMEKLRVFPDISPTAWEHPADRAALAAFSSIPLAGDLLKRIVGSTTERSLRLAMLSNAARAADSQFASLRSTLAACAERLDLSPVPELYVRLDCAPYAWTLGVEKPFVVLSSAALDLWDESELACVMAHEVGHVLSGHAVYKTLLSMLVRASSALAGSVPLGGAALSAATAALREWDRKSELSADRASLLATQDPQAVLRALMKSAAGARIGQMDVNEFLRQAGEYEAGQGGLDSLFKFLDLIGESHPFPVSRMTAIQEWERGESYPAILAGEYPRRSSEGERDAARDFAGARESYSSEFASSADPISQAAGRVIDALGELFGRAQGKPTEEGEDSSRKRPGSIEDAIDRIFGPKDGA
jgi:Zn-dependent protease with chaperone function